MIGQFEIFRLTERSPSASIQGHRRSIPGHGRSIIKFWAERDGSVKFSTKLFWALFFLFSFYGFLLFLMIFEVFGEFMIEIRWNLNREQQLYDQRKQLLLICH